MCVCNQDSPRLKKVGKYIIGEQIGNGAFSTVHVAMDSATGDRVAVKVCCKADYEKGGMSEDLLNEVKTQKSVKHTHVMGIQDDVQTSNNRYLIMELCKTTLLDEILCNEQFSESKAKTRFLELISGLHACHAAGIVHRDIKPDNILISHNGVSKLSDFGFARSHIRDEQLAVGAGTGEYLPPECYSKFKQGVTTASGSDMDFFAIDMWSSGVVLYTMLTGRLPFSRKELHSSNCHRYPEFPQGLSPSVRQLLYSLFSSDPSQRPTTKEVLSHPWLAGDKGVSLTKHETILKKMGRRLKRVLKGL
eukprot:TRINITY_DN92_c0_g3_i1.p1 TRINITY_DN92_c0_g3~~TRINITY_DN92_c0_g3_i1.p1  ORF type:complete len:317 (+),score=55.60 TRINITY_DN92_c0_g3_i1:37-951(+)